MNQNAKGVAERFGLASHTLGVSMETMTNAISMKHPKLLFFSFKN